MRGVHVGWLCAVLISSGAAAQDSQRRPSGYRFDDRSERLPISTELSGTSSTGPVLVDVDRDGDLDLFIAQGTAGQEARANLLYINRGRGRFSDESATRLPQGRDANSTKASFADVDGDGDVDAIVANLGPEQLLWNDGSGHFNDASERLPPPPDLLQDISANAQFADVDGDGCPDVLVSNENPFDPDALHGAQNRILMNHRAAGSGGHARTRCSALFTDETATRLPALTDQTTSMLAGDIDVDGDSDILVLNRGQKRVLINDGRGVFSDETAQRFVVTTDATRAGVLVDLNADGALDLLTANSRNAPPAVYWNDGAGRFALGNFGYTEAADETDTDVQVADLNCDGYLDVYIANAGRFDSGHGFAGGPDHFFENHGGVFVENSAAFEFPGEQASTGAAFGDLDADGDIDLVVTATGDGDVGRERVFLQRGRGCTVCW